MTSTIPEAEILRELEQDTRQAWEHYQDRLRELTGAEYERAEAESWDELQSELQRLDRRREDLKADGRLTERQRSDAPGRPGHVLGAVRIGFPRRTRGLAARAATGEEILSRANLAGRDPRRGRGRARGLR